MHPTQPTDVSNDFQHDLFNLDPGRYSSEFLVRVCRRVLQSRACFRPKNVIFHARFLAFLKIHTRFQTRPLTETQEIIDVIITYMIRIFLFLSCSFGKGTINTFIHFRSSLENRTRSQNKMGQRLYPFSDQNSAKTILDWVVQSRVTTHC